MKTMSKMKDLLLDQDVGDSITIASLLQSYDNLLYNKQEAEEGRFCHPEDKAYYDEMLDALERVINHYTVNGDELIEKTIRESRDERASRMAKLRLGNMNSLDF
jgi:hypothetical protein